MEYAKQYSADDLHEMFANDVDNETLATWETAQMAEQLQELAPEMTDSVAVALAIKANAVKNQE